MTKFLDYKIFFGDTNSSPFSIEEFRSTVQNQNNLLLQKINQKLEIICKSIKKNSFIHQVHGTSGLIINTPTDDLSFSHQGDFIISNIKNLAIGVLTADCLPIIFHDPQHKVVAIAHAGWRGTVENISEKVIQNMKNSFYSNPEKIDVFFGPSAKPCCYEVDNNFEKNINDNFKTKTLIYKKDKIFFDVPLYNKLILEEAGIKRINTNNNLCTMCNENFCSYRKYKEKSGLQISLVMLK